MFDTNLVPGIGEEREAQYRRLFWSEQAKHLLPAGRVIDGSKSRDPGNTDATDTLRAGMPLGKITASGCYAPSILGVITAACTSSATTITVSAAAAGEVIRRVGTSGTLTLVGPPDTSSVAVATTVTFSAVTVDGDSSTITVTALGVAKTIGSVLCPADGSQAILTLQGKEDGLKVTDRTGASAYVQAAELPLGGMVDPSWIVFYSDANTAVQAWIKARLRAVGVGYVFKDELVS